MLPHGLRSRGLAHLAGLLLFAACEPAKTPGDPSAGDGETAESPDTDARDSGLVEVCDGVDNDGDGLVDEGFPDADTNGRVDCLDVECPPLEVGGDGDVPIVSACEGLAVGTGADPWNVVLEYRHESEGVITMPVVGSLTDDDGDGDVDEDDVPEIVFTDAGYTLVALDGATGAVRFEAAGYYPQCGVAIADVTGDGTPEVIAQADGMRICAVDGTGVQLWCSPQASVGFDSYPTVADLDGDGVSEVIFDEVVFDGQTGATFVALDSSWSTEPRTPIVADLEQDGSPEILLGRETFDALGGGMLWDVSARGDTVFAAVMDLDGDPEGEVVVVSDTIAWLYDADGDLLTAWNLPGGDRPGPPCVADLDADGEPEVVIPNSPWLSAYEVDGTLLWSAEVFDGSGAAGCSTFDFDGDGAYEVLYADEIAFRIHDGGTGSALFETFEHTSGTLFEYPVVADVDRDGSAEIVVADNGLVSGVSVYGHAQGGWPRGGATWPTHDFAGTNVEPDGHVPLSPKAPWLSTGVFRGRRADDPAADLVVEITDSCVADCTFGPISLAFQVSNQGATYVRAGRRVAIYAEEEGARRLVSSVELPALEPGERLRGMEVALTPAELGAERIVVRVDDDGTGAGAQHECDETNNEASIDGCG